MNKALLKELLEKIEIYPTVEQLEKFAVFQEELRAWNQKFNLTAIEEDEEIIIKHFYDSLLGMKINGWQSQKSLLDLGTGAGFPGIPLKIMNPELKVTLVDSLQKRIGFLEHIIKKIQLTETQAVHARAEELGQSKEYREKFDYVVSRAVAKLPVLTEYCLPFAKVGGKFIAYKGPEGQEEYKSAIRAVFELGGQLSEIKDFILPNQESKRLLIVINKTASTPGRFPRRPGIPAKKPLN